MTSIERCVVAIIARKADRNRNEWMEDAKKSRKGDTMLMKWPDRKLAAARHKDSVNETRRS